MILELYKKFVLSTNNKLWFIILIFLKFYLLLCYFKHSKPLKNIVKSTKNSTSQKLTRQRRGFK